MPSQLSCLRGLLTGLLLLIGLAVWGQPMDAVTAEARLRAGSFALEDGVHGLAELRFREVLESTGVAPSAQARAVLGLVEVAAARRQPLDAEELIDLRRAELGTQPAFRLAEARIHELNGEGDEALAIALPDPGTAWFVDHVKVHLRIYRQQNRYRDAVRLVNTVAAQLPEGAQRGSMQLAHLALLAEQSRWPQFDRTTEELLESDGLSSNQVVKVRLWQGVRRLADPGQRSQGLADLGALADDTSLPRDFRVEAGRALGVARLQSGEVEQGLQRLQQAESLVIDRKDRAVLRLLRAAGMVDHGQLEEAAVLYRKQVAVLGDDPRLAEGWLHLGRRFEEMDRPGRAEEVYREYLNFFTSPSGRQQAGYGLGWSLLQQDRFAAAADQFKRLVESTSDPRILRDARYLLADAWFGAGEFDLARAQYRRFIQESPDDDRLPQALFQESLSFLRNGETDAAVQGLRNLQRLYPQSLFAQRSVLQLGTLFQERGEWDQAELVYRSYLETFPGGAEADEIRLQLGLVAQGRGQLAEAQARYTSLVEERAGTPQAIKAEYLLAYLTLLEEPGEVAEQRFREFAARYADTELGDRARLKLGQLLFNRTAYQEAVQTFSELAGSTDNPTVAETGLFWAGRAALADKAYPQALEFFNQIVNDFPGSARQVDALFWQGDTLMAAGEYSTAVLVFSRILSTHSGSTLVPMARIRKGDCQVSLAGAAEPVDRTRYREAVNSYQLLLSSPDAPPELKLQAETKIAETLRKLGDSEQALDHFRRVVFDYLGQHADLPPGAALWFTRAAFTAAEMYESLGQFEDAVKIYEHVVTLNLSAAAEARQRIQRLSGQPWENSE